MAHTAIVRQFLGPGVRRVDLRDGSLVGTLFVPAGPGSHPAALVVTGSSGGLAWANQVAALLASRGRAALALAYFDWQGRDGLPAALSEIPLEYFTAGIDRLLSEPGVDANDLAAVGMSKGGELVLLLATADPRISRVVAYVPSSVVWQATRAAPSVVAQSSWSRGGKPLAFVPAEPDAEFFRTFDRRRLRPIYDAALADSARARQAAIPVERIAGPVLLISGSGDEVWPSGPMSEQVLSRRKAFGAHSDDRHLSFAGMGHVFGVPFLPAFASDDDLALAAHAEREAWEAVLVFLTEAGRGR